MEQGAWWREFCLHSLECFTEVSRAEAIPLQAQAVSSCLSTAESSVLSDRMHCGNHTPVIPAGDRSLGAHDQLAQCRKCISCCQVSERVRHTRPTLSWYVPRLVSLWWQAQLWHRTQILAYALGCSLRTGHPL